MDIDDDQNVPVNQPLPLIQVEVDDNVENYREELDAIFNNDNIDMDMRFQAEEFNQLEDDEMINRADEIENFLERYQQIIRGEAEGRKKKSKTSRRKHKTNKHKTNKHKTNKRKHMKNKTKGHKTKGHNKKKNSKKHKSRRH